MNQNSNLSRRNFLKSSATIGTIGAVGAVGGIPLLSSCSSEERKKKGEELKLPQLLDQAPIESHLQIQHHQLLAATIFRPMHTVLKGTSEEFHC